MWRALKWEVGKRQIRITVELNLSWWRYCNLFLGKKKLNSKHLDLSVAFYLFLFEKPMREEAKLKFLFIFFLFFSDLIFSGFYVQIKKTFFTENPWLDSYLLLDLWTRFEELLLRILLDCLHEFCLFIEVAWSLWVKFEISVEKCFFESD